jgi:26S proteasome regulatory subunit N9
VEILDSVKKSLETLSDVDPKVYAHLSRAYAVYYRRKEDYENFYKSSLQYLAYTPASELSVEEKRDWSIKLGMAILLGKNIYNIMELVSELSLTSVARQGHPPCADWLRLRVASCALERSRPRSNP